MNPWWRNWVVGYSESDAKTATFILFDASKNFCLWRQSRQMMDFHWKLNLKPVGGSDRNIEEFKCVMGMIEETNFR